MTLHRIIMTLVECFLYYSLCQALTDCSHQPLDIDTIIIPHFTNGETEAQKVKHLAEGHTASQCLPYETEGS